MFQQRMSALARASGLELYNADHDTAVFRHRQMHTDYWIGVSALIPGKVRVAGRAKATWQGRAPPEAFELMRRLQGEIPGLDFSVSADGGLFRCWAGRWFRAVDEITPSALYDLAVTITDAMARADRAFHRSA